jgi:hypothetical protein
MEARMLRSLTIAVSLTLLAGCATTAELADSAPEASFDFQKDYSIVSECLVRALNQHYQASSTLGRSISHHIQSASSTRNQVVHEHFAPTTAWLFNVDSMGSNRATASVHVVHNLTWRDAYAAMEQSAIGCGGIKRA